MPNRLQRLQLQCNVNEMARSTPDCVINDRYYGGRRVVQIPRNQEQQTKSTTSSSRFWHETGNELAVLGRIRDKSTKLRHFSCVAL